MAKPYSMDLRERVVAAVEKEGLSRRHAAWRFEVGVSTVINWVRRFRETGSVAPGQMGGHKRKKIQGDHRIWLLERAREKDFTLRGLVSERGLEVDYRSVWNFVHAEKLIAKPTITYTQLPHFAPCRRWKSAETLGFWRAVLKCGAK
jgi:putative transposase